MQNHKDETSFCKFDNNWTFYNWTWPKAALSNIFYINDGSSNYASM